jgi:hypothetical protein
MAGRCYPEQPRFKNDAEKRVWTAFRSKLRNCDALLHSVVFCGRDGDWETDLVVLMPEGFATVEVKAGKVRYEGGEYVQIGGNGRHVIDLADQAKSEKYLVRRYVKDHPRWSGPSPRMVHLVALPDTEQAADDLGPGLPRYLVIAQGEERDAMGRIYDLLRGKLENQPQTPPGPDGVEAAVEILAGRGDSQAEVAAWRSTRAEVVNRLTQQQYAVLDMARRMPRYQVVGGPGTGKTFLAVEQARRWAAAGERVAFVAYSRGLTSWVERLVAAWPEDLRGRVDVTTFHALGFRWGAVASESAKQPEWDVEIPQRMAELAADLGDDARYDAIVVDEGQDFGDLWWPALFAAYRDGASGHLAVFSDATQQVFGREGADDLGLPELTLDENLRNSGPISATVNLLMPESMTVLGGQGPAVRFVACSSDDAVAAADDEAEKLLDAGWSPVELALLTTHHRHPVQVELVETHGREGYWDTLWDGDQFFYATVPGFKGLERPAIVLAVDGFRDDATARETLLVGLSRARDQLVVCGDPEVLTRVGGKELVKRLERGAS